jgi:hypothetical protein
MLSKDFLDPIIGLSIEMHEKIFILRMVDIRILCPMVIQPKQQWIRFEIISRSLKPKDISVQEVLFIRAEAFIEWL